MNAPVRRRPDGTLLPGFTANKGGRPRALADALKEKYRDRLPELMDRLFLLAGPNNPPPVQIAAIRELLDRLLGKPQVTIEATNKPDWTSFGAMYVRAMQKAGLANAHVVPSEQAGERKANEIDADNNGSVGAARDPKE